MGPDHGSAAPVVVPARDGRLLDRFIRLPWAIYHDDPAWVPPLLADVRKVLDRSHPFHRHADVEYFLALRGDDVVGRIAAIVNHAYNDFHEDRTGFIGLFESVDDPAVAGALLDAATAWLRERGMQEAAGPFNLSTNDELYSPGILLDSFDRPPLLLMGHNPAYYARLFEAAGWTKTRDLLSYWLQADAPPERLVRAMNRLASSIEGLTIREMDLRHLDREVERVKEVYNAAWERNWGFTPLTDAEIRHMAKDLKPIIDPRLALIAEVRGEPVGFALALPDYNQALKHLNGRLLPFGIFKLLWYRRRIDQVRVFTLGLKPAYRRHGIDALLYLRIYQNGLPAGFGRGEASWILEDNWEMRRALERMGGFVYKTYRVYGKSLA
ncbi:MAG TPA: hypothetical protein VMM12_07340 [Longimicrobiales bacterium]|nr:hypothetical protein [Longimicrobiales bacterium]